LHKTSNRWQKIRKVAKFNDKENRIFLTIFRTNYKRTPRRRKQTDSLASQTIKVVKGIVFKEIDRIYLEIAIIRMITFFDKKMRIIY
jgi:hypothetical protein